MSQPVGYPLSAQQAALVARGRSDHTVAVTVSLPGVPADQVPALLDAAVGAHEVLRSTLQRSAELRTPLQLVHESSTSEWTVVDDIAGLGEAAAALADRVDPDHGPVLLGAVAANGTGAWLALCASALFADLRTLEALAGQVAGAAPPADPIQYTEYAAWQAEILAEQDSEDHRSAELAWSRLHDDEVRTSLPALAAPPSPSAAPAGIEAAIGVARWLAAWTIAVARFTGERELTLGVEVDPTDNPELEGAAGPYARIVPLTFTVPVSGSFTAYADQVGQALAQARTWFEWAPVGATVPVVFAVGEPTATVDREPHQVELRVRRDGSAGAVLAGDQASPGLCDRIHAGLGRLVSALADSDAIEDLDVLGADEVGALLGPAPAAASGEPVLARVLAHGRDDGAQVALTDGETTLTYAELVSRVDGLAGAIRAAAAGAGAISAPVALWVPRSVDAIVAMLAAQRAGLGYVPLDVDGPAERALLQTRLAGSTVMVAADAALAGFEGAVVAVDAAVDAASDDAAGLPSPSADQTAYVLFTSGSTGVPKGVLVGQDNVAGYADGVLEVIEAAAGKPGRELTWALVTGVTTDLGLTSVLGALASGGTLHVVPSGLLQDPDGLSGHLADHPIDVLKITPTHLRALLADPRAAVLPRSVLVLGGEALSWELVDLVRRRGDCRIVNHYGPTETTVGALTQTLAEVGAETGWHAGRSGTVPIGRPIAGDEALVVDERLRLVPAGAVGELVIAGVGVARGYVGDEAATSAAFVDHPYRPGVRAYRTGDLVRADAGSDGPDGDAAGAVTFLGRRDGQIKVRGFRVEPHEIEVVLAQHPDVRRAAVVLRRDLGAEPVLVGYVVTQVNPSPSEAAIRDHVARLLPEHMVPSRVVDLDTLPLRANGKLDTQALPAPPQQVAAAFEPPTGETERALAAIFSETLGAAEIGAHDDFFALGGHSLLATRVIVEIRGRLDVALPVYTLFDAPTVRQLAAEVDAARGGEPSAEELSRLIAEIASMSDEEAALLLASEGQASDEAPPPETTEDP